MSKYPLGDPGARIEDCRRAVWVEKRRVDVQVQTVTYQIPTIAYIEDPTKAYLRKIKAKGRKAIT